MDAARTLPFLRGQKSAKNPEDTAKFLEMNNENQNYYSRLVSSLRYKIKDK